MAEEMSTHSYWSYWACLVNLALILVILAATVHRLDAFTGLYTHIHMVSPLDKDG